jgi:DNA-binding response OmpR family regulator
MSGALMDPPRILVVEDEELVVYALSHTLRRDGFEVHAVDCAEDALHKLQERPYGLCFLDWRLPGLDGLQALQQIKTTWPQVRVVFMTGAQLSEEEGQLVDRLADRFIEKPFDLDGVRSMVGQMLPRGKPKYEV